MFKRMLAVIALWFTLFAPVTSLHAQTPRDFPPEVVADLQAALDAAVSDNDIPGAVLLIDTPRERFAGASGYADLETQTPLQPDDAFQIASTTKMFTAVLILQLFEEGVLTLDDPLSMWLPDQAAALPYGDQITLRHLLQHTSGLFDIENDSELLAQYFADPYQQISISEIIDRVATHDAEFAPGERWQYNGGTGYLLLGMVIETATGLPYVDALRTRILDPVGMTHTYLSDLEPPTAELVHGYALNDGTWLDVTDWDFSWAGAAGGGVSTPSDLTLFIRALFNGDLFTERGTLSVMLDTAASGDAEYGLGIRRMTSHDDPLGWGHGGRALGYVSTLTYIPTDSTVLVMMTNNGERHPALDTLIAPALAYWGVRP